MDDHKPIETPDGPAVDAPGIGARRYETPPTELPITEAEAARAAGLAHNEHLKIASGYLRGGLADGLLKHATGAISEDDGQLVKFHGMYMQDDRDIRAERTKKKLEKAYSFMIRLRIAGGVVTPKQWLILDNIATTYAGSALRATTRQTFQYHGVIKSNLKRTMAAIDSALLDTIAACGDVNRNVMAATNPAQAGAHKIALQLAKDISDTLLPKTGAWREIWLDGERVVGGEDAAEIEPVYGKTYLPRKFKTVVAVPPSNEVDIFAHDLGFIAILDKKNRVTGWNVTVGGGMGMTHGETDTFPRTADVLGFVQPEDALKAAEAVMTVQRDWGNRKNRKNARLKYTIERFGLDAFRAEVEKRIGKKLGAPKPFTFDGNGDRYGWVEGDDGRHHLTLYVPSGRIKDIEGGPQFLSGLRRIAEVHEGDFRLTGNQNVIIANVPAGKRAEIDALVDEYWPDPRGFGAAPQLHGLCRPADLRSGAGGERALPARSPVRAGGEPCPPRAAGRADHHPLDRLPQRLRPALHLGNRPRRPRPRALPPLSRRRLRWLPAEQALPRGRHRLRDQGHPGPALRRLCQGPAARRALRRFRDPRRLRGQDQQRPGLPRAHGAAAGRLTGPMLYRWGRPGPSEPSLSPSLTMRPGPS
ncbi:sulfite reductase (NADPH) hemoprotein beta-component [Methylorubrum pseudosasae]|nr:sulfite reductase (NADPH) hemoprotein beta-component [Methylorubrum pseudosasae]